jgi:hypothetical protein
MSRVVWNLVTIHGELHAAVPTVSVAVTVSGVVGVSVERSNQLRHLIMALDAAEGSFGVEHAGGGPAQHHLPVPPAGEVAVGGTRDGDHRLERYLKPGLLSS